MDSVLNGMKMDRREKKQLIKDGKEISEQDWNDDGSLKN